MEISDKKLGFWWKPHSYRINIRTFFNLCDPLWGPFWGPFSQKMLVHKIVEKSAKTYFARKCAKSISMDSGHLDKPFGPLIFQFVQHFWAISFDRFLENFAYCPGLGCRLIWLLLARFGQVTTSLQREDACRTEQACYGNPVWGVLLQAQTLLPTG